MANAEKLYETLHWCKEHPNEVDLRLWYCGTTACFAGHAAFLNGAKPLFRGGMQIAPVETPDGDIVECCVYAKSVLELTDVEEMALFYCDSLEEIENNIECIIGG